MSESAPSAWPGLFLAVAASAARYGCRRDSVLVSAGAGAARYASRLWRAERALGRGEGAGRGVRGKPGKPAALGGFPVSPAMLAGFRPREIRRGISARALFHGRRAARTMVLALSPVIGAAGSVVVFGGRKEGSGEPGTGAVVFLGAGAVPGSPVRFRIGLPFCLFTRVVEP